ncbi:MAG TPA: ATP-dependent DNA helicase RecG [Candidatus Gastranaerophilaceae bacterium]|nr:ATP-dependent DNA helicase RecG [Candidatus Gastranaerophilaceae bacterium]
MNVSREVRVGEDRVKGKLFENLEQIKQAIDIEIKHQYINVRGKNKTFAKFIKGEIFSEYKKSKNHPKWKILMETFDQYSTDSFNVRKKAIKRLINVIKAELEPPKAATKSAEEIKNPADVDVIYVKGVGPKVGYAMHKLGIYTAADLLFYFPRRHIDYSNRTLIKNLKQGTNTTIFGYIKSVQAFVTKNNLSVLKVKINDESASLELNFFYAKTNRRLLERYKSQFPVGAGFMASGTVKINSFDGRPTLDKPQYSIMSGDFLEQGNSNLNLGRIVPIYPLNEGISIKTLRRAIFNAIETYKPVIKNVLPDFLREKYNIMNKADAVEQMHFPKSMEELEQARFSLVFEELFLIQLKLAYLREENRKNNTAVPLGVNDKGLTKKFVESLPFELTSAQKHAINDILKDLNSKEPMQRLLQGDVGSGKTVVATIMLLAAVENGYQGAIMAPTEILAQQHYNNLVEWLTPMGLSVGMFLGSNSKKIRAKIEKDLRNSQTHIAVGTHALIQENIEFANLGAIVIDEQHRFGVKQRMLLKNKAQSPQMLTMTATPIPRTLALTVHGDLDLTVIDELPKGRKPIKTALISSAAGQKEAYRVIQREVEAGRQAYVVYPLIDESETLSAKAATIEAEKFQNEIFPQYKIGLLHGKLKNNEKEKVMADFKKKKYDILVSTTVVEVGVDVPNATVMLIENAERFGLSQLHQLRGRVGRSDLQSYCILSTSSRSAETLDRLKILTQTNDGFVIAEQDLLIRGPGEFLGTRQSGLPDLIVADLIRDAKILELARGEAINFVKCYKLDKISAFRDSLELNLMNDFDLINAG